MSCGLRLPLSPMDNRNPRFKVTSEGGEERRGRCCESGFEIEVNDKAVSTQDSSFKAKSASTVSPKLESPSRTPYVGDSSDDYIPISGFQPGDCVVRYSSDVLKARDSQCLMSCQRYYRYRSQEQRDGQRLMTFSLVRSPLEGFRYSHHIWLLRVL
ncbi:hypothetical protein EVAR_25165_1 [Eumeta japonica]|uniref:Uncharacterized protein n=1 Tax=Eumeta variegata TaxID=151549 RepID=A0A4C1VSL5_EUMVA|nr:hypothetical protein EVAR_25165_1 [Eumeta japonica]